MKYHIAIIGIMVLISCTQNRIELANNYLSSVINNRAKEFDIDPVFVTAIIYAESNFYKYAKSSAGAKGYMQIQEESAIDGLRYAGYYYLSERILNKKETLYDVDINILSGCAYLHWIKKKKMKRFENWITLMAYYNSGSSDIVFGSYILKINKYYKNITGKEIKLLE